MHIILLSTQRIIILAGLLLVLFAVWLYVMARTNAGHGQGRKSGEVQEPSRRDQPRLRPFASWKRCLAAILLGNAGYFLLDPHLPIAAQHRGLLDLGTFVDLWFCAAVYGLIELGGMVIRRIRK